MSILTDGATFAKDMEIGKIYTWSQFEVQKDKNGKIWAKNVTTAPFCGCQPGAIMEINPHEHSLFYYNRDVER